MIQLKNISKSFKNNLILSNITICIESREFILIYGKSGSGKTTLLNIIGGIEKADSGKLFIKDKTIMTSKDRRLLRRELIGFIFQNYGLVETESVKENLMLVKKYDPKQYQEVLNEVGLSNQILKRKVYELSGGEQQKVSIARTLLKQSPIILADEPTGNLDPENSKIIFDIFKKLQQSGKTIVCVSHDATIKSYCDRLFLLNNKTIQEVI